ncbi:MAG: TonB-dependent receptor [Algibacter sp.]|uniref:TonB-dependent receptor family protein n=1 Tax=Algibacter sp. TaxID=1872428 RepID=UPI002603C5A7|nr:TonB-dependent receptor [Algibacter sp.]MDG1729876.1 TonB-dependent receptor [Algibacter sp.]MDG2178732.1 TonB-dependent receptor [Algibacter sp.]
MLHIKKSIFIFAILGLVLTSNSQSKIVGKIIESDNNIPLEGVEIINIDTKKSITSKIDGGFEIFNEGIYSFNKKGYVIKSLNLIFNQYYIIQLELKPSELNEVIVHSNHIPKALKKATASITVITSKDIKRSNNINFAPILNRVPGVFMQSGALNTNRITIRGIGARNLFGTSKIRAYFKDIPLTNGSGETNIEDFELASMSQFEIIKGPASSIYGAGLGGVIQLKPKNALLNQTHLNTEFSFGSFGLNKGIINVNHGSKKNSLRAVYSNTQSNGYRENNEYNRQTFTLHTNHFLSKKSELSFLTSYVDLKAFIPSSINETDYLNNPESAAFTWKQAQGFEDSKRGVFGISLNQDYSSNLKHTSSIFTSFNNAYEPRPFNILKENTFAIGIRSRLLGKSRLFSKNMNWTLGGELFRDTYNYKTFENLYNDFPTGTGSVMGNQLSNFKEKRNYYNIFAETNFETSNRTTITLGVNLNKTAYNLEDNFITSAENPDQSGAFKFKNIASPKLGVSHLISKNFSIHSSISHGFSPITLNETLLPNGQINTNLKPETGWNYEIGTRGTTLKNKLQYSASIYRLDIKNLLVSRRTAQDEFISVNAGSTQHDGLELALNYNWFQKESLSINSFMNYTHNNFIFKKFIENTNDFSGNNLTGVPKNILNAGIDFDLAFGIYGNINYQYVGSMPITDSNSLYSDNYSLTNLKFGYQANLNKTLKLNIFFGVNNIFNEQYASQILINASGFGGNAPRYFYPGNPVNYFSGLHVNYVF